MRTRLTIDLDPEQKQRLSQLAKRRHISVRELVLESLDESLQRGLVEADDALPSLAGALSHRANPTLWDREASAWGPPGAFAEGDDSS